MKSLIKALNLSIFLFIIKNVISLLDFTYPSAINLPNKNIFIVEKEGIYVYDENMQNIENSYLFQEENEKINNLDILSNVRIISKGNLISCLINRKIFFFDYEGKFFSKTDILISEETYYYPALTYIQNEGNYYYYTISYIIDSYKQRVLYYRLNIYDKSNNPINQLTLNEMESKNGLLTDKYDYHNMGLSCDYMQCENKEQYNLLVCFMTIKKSNKISLASNYFAVTNSISIDKEFKAAYLDDINEVKQIQSVVRDDRKNALVCLLYTNGILICYKFHFVQNTFRDDVEFYSSKSINFNCRNTLYGMKLSYLDGGNIISLSCINSFSTVQAIFFNNNLDLIDSVIHTQFTQCSTIYGHSIVQSNSLFYVISDAICENYKRSYEPLDGDLSPLELEVAVDCLDLEKCEKCGEESSINNLCLKCNNDKNYYYLNRFPSKPKNDYIDCINEAEKPSNYFFNQNKLAYEPCFSTCTTCDYGGSYEENNCTSCDGINYIKNPENEGSTNCLSKCRYLYYIEDDVYSCTTSNFCPEKYSYKIKEKFKCIDNCKNDNKYKYRYNGECFSECPNKTNDDNDFICKDIQNNECYLTEKEINSFNENTTFEEIEYLVIKYTDEFNYTKYHVSQYIYGNYTITLYIINECILELGLGISKIEFGPCYEKIKNGENFTNQELIIAVIDKKIGSKNNKKIIKYGIFSSITGKYLNSDEICSDDKITLINSLEEKLSGTKISIQTLEEFASQGIDLFDMSGPFYNDVCFKYNSKKDIALKDRVLEYFPNITLCEEGCDLIGINITTITAICECYFSETKREENLKDKVLEQAQIGFIEDIINKSNIYVIKCIKSVLKIELIIKYIKKCYGVFIILFLIFIEIICTIIYCISSKKSIDKYILNLANNYIDYLNKKNNNKVKFKNDNKIKIKEKTSRKNAPPKRDNKNKTEKTKSNYLKNRKYLTNQNKTSIKKNYNIIINAGQNSIFKRKQNNIKIPPSKRTKLNLSGEFSNSSGKILKFENKNEISQYKSFFISMNNKSKINIVKYLETGYDEMDYDEALRKDKRKFCRAYSEKLQDNHIIINTFCSNEPIRPKSIKIIFFILQLDLYFFINGLFYNEEYISKIYHLEKDTIYTMLSRLFDNLIYATFASIIVSYIIEFFFIEEKKIKSILKIENKNILLLKYALIQILKSIKTRYIFFIIFSYIISLLSLFHIFCFNIVYYHTMQEWIFFSVIIILSIQLLSFLICFFQTCLRFTSFKFKSEKLFKLSV